MAHRTDHCLNCGAPTPDKFCAACGQKNADYRESILALIGETIEELFQLDSRLGHTLVPFLFRPGMLTRDYNAGRRVRYSSPLRMYLFLSVLYFFLLSLTGVGSQTRLRIGLDPAGHGFSISTADSEISVNGAADAPDGGERSQVDGGQREDQDDDGASDDRAVDGGQRDASEADAGPPGRWLSRLSSKSEELNRLGPEAMSRRLIEGTLSNASRAVFLLLPIFALLLRTFFRAPRKFYVEHLVFAIHYHSFIFLLLLVALLPLGWISWLLVPAALLYLGIALHTVYGNSWLRTAWKMSLLVLLYVLVLAGSLAGVVMATLLL